MNKDELQQRIASINNEMIQTKANYAKLEGHLGEAQHWLTDLINKENAVQEEAPEEAAVAPEELQEECLEQEVQ